MRVLVIGANGFIGSSIVASLLGAGFVVRGLARKPEKVTSRFPNVEAIAIDLSAPSAQHPEAWGAALTDVDAVINAAGVLQPRREDVSWAVHEHMPKALFKACQSAGVRRVVQISAVGVEEGTTVFARSKLAGDKALMSMDLDWTLLRPAIVVGDGSYGGTSMLRAIAAFPWMTPVIGDGETELGFIHKDDLALSIIELLRTGAAKKKILEPASAERLSLSRTVQAYRSWLGLGAAPVFRAPRWCINVVAKLGDWFKLDPVTSTAVAQFDTQLTGNAAEFEAATGVRARSLREILANRPAEVQDLWHARLYLIRPLVRLVLALLWLTSGFLGLFAEPAAYAAVLEPLTENPLALSAVAVTTSVIDLIIAAALFAGWRLKEFAVLQLLMVFGYTVTLTIFAPYLWGDLFGGVLKNLPILALLLVHRVLEEER